MNVQQSLLAIFEALCGLCPSVRSDNVQDLFLFLSQFLEMSVSLAEVYCDVTVIMVLILELFALVAENFISYLNKVSVLPTIISYALHHMFGSVCDCKAGALLLTICI